MISNEAQLKEPDEPGRFWWTILGSVWTAWIIVWSLVWILTSHIASIDACDGGAMASCTDTTRGINLVILGVGTLVLLPITIFGVILDVKLRISGPKRLQAITDISPERRYSGTRATAIGAGYEYRGSPRAVAQRQVESRRGGLADARR